MWYISKYITHISNKDAETEERTTKRDLENKLKPRLSSTFTSDDGLEMCSGLF